MTTEIAHRPNAAVAHVPVGKPLETLEQIIDLSKALAFSSLVPDTLRGKPNDVGIILMYGAELGLPPMQSIQGIYVVKGRPMLSAQTWGTKIRQCGHKMVILTSTRTEATVCITRGDDHTQHVETFTIEDAVAAGLCQLVDGKVRSRSRNKPEEPLPWEAWTRTMLRNRAITHCARYACPEAAFGAGIWGEEHSELEDEVDLRPFVEDDNPVDGELVDEAATAQELADLANELGVTAKTQPEPDVAEEVIDPWGAPVPDGTERECEICGIQAVPGSGQHNTQVFVLGYDEHEPVWTNS